MADISLADELRNLKDDIDASKPNIDDFPLDKQQTIFKPLPQYPKKETRGRKPIKLDLIDKIHKLQHALGRPQDDTAKLKFLSVAKLNEKLAQLTTKGTNVYFNVVPEEPEGLIDQTEQPVVECDDDDNESDDSESGGNILPRARLVTDRLAVQQLFTFNMVIARGLELTTSNFKEQLGGVDCNGLCKDLLEPENKELLEEILRQIYKENSKHIKEYLTPFNQYALFMIGATANRMTINAKKND